MRILIVLEIALFLLCACSISSSPTAAPISTTSPNELSGDYIGQTLPAAAPIPFGLRVMRGSFHSAPVFSPDGNKAWWAGEYGEAKIYHSKIVEGVWTKPATVQFSSAIVSYRDPFISPDGSRFYFISAHPLPDLTAPEKENIWMMEKMGDGWSEPQPLPESINSLALHWTISVAENNNLYFSALEGDGFPDIYLSRYENGTYTDPVLLEVPINSEHMEITPNIAPDESYILFSRLVDHTSTPYLYISYASDSGWTEPVKVGNVSYCISPIVTPDRKYVIYLSSPASFSWRDTTFIEELRP